MASAFTQRSMSANSRLASSNSWFFGKTSGYSANCLSSFASSSAFAFSCPSKMGMDCLALSMALFMRMMMASSFAPFTSYWVVITKGLRSAEASFGA